MKTLSIDISRLISREFTPTEYVYCSLIKNKHYTSFEALRDIVGDEQTIIVLASLRERGYINFIVDSSLASLLDPANIIVTSKFHADFEVEPASQFEEFREAFPKKTPNGRRLHNKTDDCKKKYNAYVKNNLGLHKLILKSLRLEVDDRIATERMDFMQLMSTYIQQKSWEMYMEDAKQDENNGQKEGGGGNVLD